jgi:HlyD family secretion protein
MRTRFVIPIALIAAGAAAATAYTRLDAVAPVVTTDVVSRGSVVNVISASGTLQAVETVEVGTQVSGSVKALGADFNSIVRKGQVLARLDPSLIQADVERAKANVAAAEADVERLQVQLGDANTKLTRARELASRQLIPQSDLDAAVMATRTAEAQVKSAAAQATQVRATLRQAQVNLQKTVITSPIDGIVISRAVDVGQTVAASLQAPTLFTLAADLGQMELNASIDESDVGSIREGQTVSFRVDAYPNDRFSGVVKQVRLNPTVDQNVVTYAAIIATANPQLKLKPGMTASLSVEVARRDGVLRVPSSALRFRPSAAVLAALESPAAPQAGIKPVASVSSGPTGGVASAGTIWSYEGGRLMPVSVTIGISDAQYTEVQAAGLQEGARIATQAAVPGSSGTASAPRQTTSNPLLGQPPVRRM